LCGLATHPPAAGRKQTKTRNLLVRLRDRDQQVLLFARDLTVPFTNNQAERDRRPAKTQLKISGCHGSETGARAWIRLRGYILHAYANTSTTSWTRSAALHWQPLDTAATRDLDGYYKLVNRMSDNVESTMSTLGWTKPD
jgi:hypothetical protein